MSLNLEACSKPVVCFSASLPVNEYTGALRQGVEGKQIVLLAAQRPIAILTLEHFTKLLAYAAVHGIAPSRVFQSVRRQIPVLPGHLALDGLFQHLRASDLELFKKGCLISDGNRVIGALDYTALVAAMLAHIQSRPVTARDTQTEAETSLEGSLQSPVVQVGILAHEIRTPLTGIIGLAELLERRVKDKVSRNMAASLVRTSHALDRLLTDTLDYTALQAGYFETESHPCNLQEFVNDLQQVWAHEAAQRNLGYEVEFWPTGPHEIMADLGRIRQIANNLISNALKFTARGRVTVNVSTQSLRDNIMLILSVTDTGQGISQSEQILFQQMFKKGKSEDHTPGWGLGLTICNALAKELGGELSYSKTPTHGSMFSLTLPVERLSVTKTASDTPQRRRYGKFEIGEVLLVEDHEASAMIALQILENAGWQVCVAGSVSQAQSHLRNKAYQAVLTDIHLPDGNALDLIEYMRKQCLLNANTPIIAMTADISNSRRQSCLDAGADRALKKPLQGPALIACLADILMARAARSDLPMAQKRLAS